jgi:hypothetical protein
MGALFAMMGMNSWFFGRIDLQASVINISLVLFYLCGVWRLSAEFILFLETTFTQSKRLMALIFPFSSGSHQAYITYSRAHIRDGDAAN